MVSVSAVVLMGIGIAGFMLQKAHNEYIAGQKAYEQKVATHPLTTTSILNDMNDARRSNGVGTLSYNLEIEKSAMAKCSDMVTKKYYEHTGPDGRTVKDWLNDNTKNWKKGNENLNIGNFRASFEVVDSWMNSPGHKNTMLDSQFTDTGIAICDYPDGQKIVVEQFALYYTAEEIQAIQQKNSPAVVYRRAPILSPGINCTSYRSMYGTSVNTYCH